MALYGQGGHRWAFTERRRTSLSRDANRYNAGPSGMYWDGTCLTIRVEEMTFPIPGRLRGTIRVYPEAIDGAPVALDDAGRHEWRPIAPCSRIEVDFLKPALRWKGRAYIDSNRGSESLEQGFAEWDWSRATLADGSTAVLYDATQSGGASRCIARRFSPKGDRADFEPGERHQLPGTGWRIARATRAANGAAPRVLATLEDTPFYARSLLSTQLLGEPVVAMHESLSLGRFSSPIVQWMLPFRMPRARR